MAYIGNKPANKAVVASDLDPAVITGQTALATSPADTDEFLISDAGVLKRLDASLVGGGKIGQVVTSTNNGYATTSSATSFTDLLSASGTTWETAITPTATSSKILVLPAVYVRNHWSGGNDARGTINMMAKIGGGSYAEIDRAYEFGVYDYGGSGIILAGNYTPIQLYTSNTTDEVKIKFQIKAANTSMTIATNWGSGDDVHVSRVTLLEVLA